MRKIKSKSGNNFWISDPLIDSEIMTGGTIFDQWREILRAVEAMALPSDKEGEPQSLAMEFNKAALRKARDAYFKALDDGTETDTHMPPLD